MLRRAEACEPLRRIAATPELADVSPLGGRRHDAALTALQKCPEQLRDARSRTARVRWFDTAVSWIYIRAVSTARTARFA
jgi:hypothetical protein